MRARTAGPAHADPATRFRKCSSGLRSVYAIRSGYTLHRDQHQGHSCTGYTAVLTRWSSHTETSDIYTVTDYTVYISPGWVVANARTLWYYGVKQCQGEGNTEGPTVAAGRWTLRPTGRPDSCHYAVTELHSHRVLSALWSRRPRRTHGHNRARNWRGTLRPCSLRVRESRVPTAVARDRQRRCCTTPTVIAERAHT